MPIKTGNLPGIDHSDGIRLNFRTGKIGFIDKILLNLHNGEMFNAIWHFSGQQS